MRRISLLARLGIATSTSRHARNEWTPSTYPQTLNCGVVFPIFGACLARACILRGVFARGQGSAFGTVPARSRCLWQQHRDENLSVRLGQSARVLRAHSWSNEPYDAKNGEFSVEKIAKNKYINLKKHALLGIRTCDLQNNIPSAPSHSATRFFSFIADLRE